MHNLVRRSALAAVALAALAAPLALAPQATAGSTPPATASGFNAGPAICSPNDGICGGTSRQSISNFDDQRITPPQLVSTNGRYRFYVHGQTCQGTLEEVATGRVIWRTPINTYTYNPCGSRPYHNTQWVSASVGNDSTFRTYYNDPAGNSFITFDSHVGDCRSAPWGVDVVVLNEGYLAAYSDTDNPYGGRQQQWNSNWNGKNQNGQLGCK